MGIKASDFGSIKIEQRVGLGSSDEYPEFFKSIKFTGFGNLGRNADDHFGTVVAIDNDLAVVGSPDQDYDSNGLNVKTSAGAAYIFRRIFDTWEQFAKITPVNDSRYSNDKFGSSVAISNGRIVIGSPNHSYDANNANPITGAGAVYVIEYDGEEWSVSNKLVATGTNARVANDAFGTSVSIVGDIIVVGTPNQSTNDVGNQSVSGAGAAYVFSRNDVNNTWTQIQKVIAQGGERYANDQAGYSAFASNNTLIIGAPYHSYADHGLNYIDSSGAAFIFNWNGTGWVYEAKLYANDRASLNMFGESVVLYGDYAAIGCPSITTGDSAGGKVYVFKRESFGVWRQLAILPMIATLWFTDQDIRDYAIDYVDVRNTNVSRFGDTLAMSDDLLLVGQPQFSALYHFDFNGQYNYDNLGSVHVYKRDGDSWIYLTSLRPEFPFPLTANNVNEYYGCSVAIKDSMIVIGAKGHNLDEADVNPLSQAGAVYVYNWDGEETISLTSKLIGFGTERNTNDALGTSIAYSNGTLVASAPYHSYDLDGKNYILNAGAIYIWNWNGSSWVFGQKIVPTGTNARVASDLFGSVISIHNDTLAVGVPTHGYNTSGSGFAAAAGAVFVYKKSSGVWTQIQKIVASGTNGRVASDNFGRSISIFNDTIVIGSKNSYDSSGANSISNAGAVFVYDYDEGTYSLTTKIVAPSASRTSGSEFGTSIDLKNEFLLIGAPKHTLDFDDLNAQTDSGAVWLYQNVDSEWTYVDKFTGWGQDRNANDRFGISVVSDGSTLAVSAPYHSYDANSINYVVNAGAVYVYVWDGSAWYYTNKLVSTTRTNYGKFGWSLSLSGDNLIVGAPGERSGTDSAFGLGVVYAFRRTFGVWDSGTKITPTGTNVDGVSTSGYVANPRFGWSVSVSGDILAVSQPWSSYSSNGTVSPVYTGAVYTFKRDSNNTWTQEARLTAETFSGGRTANQLFGFSVDLQDNLLLIGAPGDSTDASGLVSLTNAGAAFIFRRESGSWIGEQKIIGFGQDRSINDQLSASMKLYDNTLIVGSPNHSYGDGFVSAAGAVYVWNFVNGNWAFVQKLYASGTNARIANDHFGASVDIDENHIIVGAPNHGYDGSGANLISNAGAAFVFTMTDNIWSQKAKLVASGTNARRSGTLFGSSVAIDKSAGVIAIGAKGATTDSSGTVQTGSDFGNAYVFEGLNDSWTQVARFSQPAGSLKSGSLFGYNVQVKDSFVLVSCPLDNISTAISAGTVYVYKKESGTYSFFQRITGPMERQASDNFGASMAIDNDVMVIGAPNHSYGASKNDADQFVSNSGAAYVWTRRNGFWYFEQKITPTGTNSRTANAMFGTAVAISGNNIAIGVPNDDYDSTGANLATDAGSVYVFKNQGGITKRYIKRKIINANSTFNIPENLTGNSLRAKLWGAGGGRYNNAQCSGGGGAFLDILIDTTGLTSLDLVVGTGGQQSSANLIGGAGGGYTAIKNGSTFLAIAGAGGGSGYSVSASGPQYAGAGGVVQGQDGITVYNFQTVSKGGTQSAGGAGGLGNANAGQAGSYLTGGNAGGTLVTTGGIPGGGQGSGTASLYGGGGGGAGYYGGGGGSGGDPGNQGQAGAGGSSYWGHEAVTYINGEDGNRAIPGGSTDSLYPGIGARGASSSNGLLNGESGIIILEWEETYVSSNWTQNARITPTGTNARAANNLFGYSVGISSNVLVVGAPGNSYDESGSALISGAGAAWIFEDNGSTWDQVKKITGGTIRDSNAAFGTDVAISSDIIVVGGPVTSRDADGQNSLSSSGMAWVFEKSNGTWAETKKLTGFGQDRIIGDLVNSPIAVYGNYLVVGSPNNSYDDSINASGVYLNKNYKLNAGAAFIWSYNGSVWTFEQKIAAPTNNRVAGNKFGTSVAIYDDIIVIGSPNETTGTSPTYTNGGASYVFRRNGTGYTPWVLEQRILPDSENMRASALNGTKVAANGTTIAIGATGDETYGSVYVYTVSANVWSLQQKVVPTGTNSRVASDLFGSSISLKDNILIVGATGQDYDMEGNNPVSNSGAIFVFIRSESTWTQQQKIVGWGHDRGADKFGWSLSGDNISLAVGAPEVDYDKQGYNYVTDSGAVYTWTWQGNPGAWVFEEKIVPPSQYRASNNKFGWSVSINGDKLAVGAVNEDSKGAVYVYSRTAGSPGTSVWTLQNRLIPTGTNAYNNGDQFGYTVAIQDTTNSLVVGAPNHGYDASGANLVSNAGAIYTFTYSSTWTQSQKLVATNFDRGAENNPSTARNSGDNFGYTVALRDNIMIVGSPNHGYDQNGLNPLTSSGAAYVYTRADSSSNWSQSQKLIGWGQDRNTNDHYGFSMAGSGNTLAIGAPDHSYDANNNYYSLNSGAVYIWTFADDTWSMVQKVTADNGTNIDRGAGDKFGYCIALENDRLVVGSPYHQYDASGANQLSNAGAVFVFDRSGSVFSKTAKIVAGGTSGRHANDRFGWSVALSGDSIVIGSPYHSYNEDGTQNVSNAGAAYVYTRSGSSWNYSKKITPRDNMTGWTGSSTQWEANDNFGWSVSTISDGGTNILIVVGAPNHSRDSSGNNSLTNAGAAWIYRRVSGSFVFEDKVTGMGNERAIGDNAGKSVAGYEDWLFVGAPNHSYDRLGRNYVSNAGAVYVFHWNGSSWILSQKISAEGTNSRNANDNFGYALAASSDYFVVGAPGNSYDEVGNNVSSGAGAIWIYTYDGSSWTPNTKIVAGGSQARGAGDNFGYSLDTNGNKIIIGAPNHSYDEFGNNSKTNAGAAYIWMFDDNESVWFQQKKITANESDRYANDKFGTSVSIEDIIAVIGAPYHQYDVDGSNPLTNAGAAFIFKNDDDLDPTNWVQREKLASWSRDRNENMHFARTLSGDNDLVAAGAPDYIYDQNTSYPLTSAGSVFIYRRQINDFDRFVSLNGSSNYINGTSVVDNFFDSGVTNVGFMGWVKSPNNGGALFSFITSANAIKYVVGFDIQGRVYVSNGSSSVSTSTGINYYNDNTWHHVAVSHQKAASGSNTIWNIWVDGIKVITNAAITGAILANTDQFRIGSAYNSTYLNGFVDDIGVWKIALTDSMIQTVMASSPADSATGLIAYWDMSGDTSTLSDLSGNSNDATLFGAYTSDNNRWRHEARITPMGLNARLENDKFGSKIDLRGDLLIAGVSDHSYDSVGTDALTGAGSAYIFRRSSSSIGSFQTVTKKKIFSYTGADQTWVVPANVDTIDVKLWGAAGNASGMPSSTGFTYGGAGGFASGTTSVTPGETLTIVVGQGGDSTIWNALSYGNGGASYSATTARIVYYSGRGGGLSALKRSSSYLIIAGGGGGGGYSLGHGGAGGGSTGQSGAIATDGLNYVGTGGTQSTGGVSTGISDSIHVVGTQYTGGGFNNGSGHNITGPTGGAGYYGGGPARGAVTTAPSGAGAGGGSGYLSGSITNGQNLQGNYNIPPNIDDIDYDGFAGQGGGNGIPGRHGLVVISYQVTEWVDDDVVWSQEIKLIPTGTNARNENDHFGYSVSVDGNIAAVGVPNHDYDADGGNSTTDAGAVFMFAYNNGSWTQTQRVVGSGTNGRVANDQFGYSVSIRGNFMVVGSPFHDFNTVGAGSLSNAGAVFVYKNNNGTWEFHQKLIATGSSGRNANDNFGTVISFNGTRIAIQSPNNGYEPTGVTSTTNAGTVFVFDYDDVNDVWIQTGRLTPSVPVIDGHYGNTISLFENTIAIGATADNRVETWTWNGSVWSRDYNVKNTGRPNSYTRFLSHFDGTSFVDEISGLTLDSSFASTFVNLSGASITTARQLYNNTGSLLTGTNAYATTVGTSSILPQGTESFTIEWWVNPVSVGTSILCANSSNASTEGGALFHYNGSGLYISSAPGQGWNVVAGTSIGSLTLNSWNHCALTRNGSTWRYFVNGAQRLTFTNSASLTWTSTTNLFFNLYTGNANSNAYYADVRITRGVSRYNAGFSVPTQRFGENSTDDPYWDNVTALYHLNDIFDVFQSNSSTTTISTGTVGGAPELTDAYSYLGTKSVVFTGSNSLTFSTGNRTFIGNKDFTFEFAVRPDQYVPTTLPAPSLPFTSANNTVASLNGMTFVISRNTHIREIGTLIFNFISGGTARTLSFGTLEENRWSHIALTRKGNTLMAFVNGTLRNVYVITTDINTIIETNSNIVFGPFNGRIDEARLTIGEAVYYKSYSTPRGRFTFNEGSVNYGSSVLLLEENELIVGFDTHSGVTTGDLRDNGTSISLTQMPGVYIQNGGLARTFIKAGSNGWRNGSWIAPVGVSDANSRFAEDKFGFAVAVHDSKVIVGAPGHSRDNYNQRGSLAMGSAYIWNASSDKIVYVGKLSIMGTERSRNNAQFGTSISAKNGYVLIGSPGYYKMDYVLNFWNYGAGTNRAQTCADYQYGKIDHYVLSDSIPTSFNNYSVYKMEGAPVAVNAEGAGVWTVTPSFVDTTKGMFGLSSAILDDDRYSYGVPGGDSSVGPYPILAAGYAIAADRVNTTLTTYNLTVPGSSNNRLANDKFGYSVSTDLNNVVIGAPGHGYDTFGANLVSGAGAAWSFRKNNTENAWLTDQKITSSSRAASAAFGSSLSVKSAYAVIGAPGTAGRGEVYYRDNISADTPWTLKLASTNYSSGDQAGYSVAMIDSNYAVIGAPYRDVNLVDAGWAQIYANSAGTFSLSGTNGVTPKDGSLIFPSIIAGRFTNDKFGTSVALENNLIAVGTPGHTRDTNGNVMSGNVGAIFTYAFSNELQLYAYSAKVTNTSGNTAALGTSVALKGDYMISGDNVLTTNTGTAKIWYQSSPGTWVLRSTLNNTVAGSQHGTAVTFVNDTRAIVGAPLYGDASLKYGAFQYFTQASTNWTQNTNVISVPFHTARRWEENLIDNTVILTNGRVVNGAFGSSVTIAGSSDNYIIVGTPNYSYTVLGAAGASNGGSAFIYVWNNTTNRYEYNTKVVHSTANSLLGSSVAASGNYVTIGAPGFTSNAGQVQTYVVTGSGVTSAWTLQLSNNGISTNENRGYSVAMRDNATAFTIAPNYLTNNQAFGAWISYSRSSSTWTPATPATPVIVPGYANGRNANDQFGYSVAVSGTTIVVGSPGHAYNTSNANTGLNIGAVWVFKKNTDWDFEQKINISTGANTRLGTNVAITNDTTIAAGITNSNGQYVAAFTRNAGIWSQYGSSIINANAGEGFGSSIGITSDGFAAGYYLLTNPSLHGVWLGETSVSITNSGAFKGFVMSGNTITAEPITIMRSLDHTRLEIQAQSNGYASGENFGSALSYDGENLAIGANLASTGNFGISNGSTSGKIVIGGFDSAYNIWRTDVVIGNPESRASGQFGTSAAISGNELIVGAPNTDTARGIVYKFYYSTTQKKWIYEFKDYDQNFDLIGSAVAVGSEKALWSASLGDGFPAVVDSGNINFVDLYSYNDGLVDRRVWRRANKYQGGDAFYNVSISNVPGSGGGGAGYFGGPSGIYDASLTSGTYIGNGGIGGKSYATTIMAGSGSTAGNSSHVSRGTAGNGGSGGTTTGVSGQNGKIIISWNDGANSQTFNYVSNASQQFVIPDGITSITVEGWGGGGGQGGSRTDLATSYGGSGSGASYGSSTFSVTPGETLLVDVGQGGPGGNSGGNASVTNTEIVFGGWPFGGNGGNGRAGSVSLGGGGAGGGLSRVRRGNTDLIVIAGGGGGAGTKANTNTPRAGIVGDQTTFYNDIVRDKLYAPGLANGRNANDMFGYAVSMSGNNIYIGSPYHSYDYLGRDIPTNGGALMVYNRTGNLTSYVTKVNMTGVVTNSYFGTSIRSFGNKIAVAAGAMVSSTSNSMSTMIFAGGRDGNGSIEFLNNDSGSISSEGRIDGTISNGGTQVAGTNSFDLFSETGAIFGWNLLDTVPGQSTITDAGGFTAVNHDTIWSVGTTSLVPGMSYGRFANDKFGTSVAMADGFFTVGAPGHSYGENGNNFLSGRGSVYVWRYDGISQSWVYETLLISNDTTTGYGTQIYVLDNLLTSNNTAGSRIQTWIRNSAANWTTNAVYNVTTSSYAFVNANMFVTGSTIDSSGTGSQPSVTNAGSVKTHVFDSSWSESTSLRVTVPGRTNGRMANDLFGSSVAIGDGFIAVGSPNHNYNEIGNTRTTGSGALYIFDISTMLQEKILVSTSNTLNNIGITTSASKNMIASGNKSYSSNAGYIEVWRRNSPGNWTSVNVITDASFNWKLGSAISWANDSTLIATRPSSNGSTVGLTATASGDFKTYTVSGNTWTVKNDTIVPGTLNYRNASDAFGTKLTMSRDYLVVSAPNHSYNVAGSSSVSNAGAIWLYGKTEDGFKFINKFVDDTRSSGAKFGSSLATDDRSIYVIVGSPAANKVNVYRVIGNNLSLMETYQGENSNDLFGTSVAATSTRIAIGSPNHSFDSDDNEATNAGAVYVYDLDNSGEWNLKEKFTGFSNNEEFNPEDPDSFDTSGPNGWNSGDNQGISVALSDNGSMIVGSAKHSYDQIGSNSVNQAGAVWIKAEGK